MEGWIIRINQQVARSAESLITLGQVFLDAKNALNHGDWQNIFRSGKLRFSLRWAQRLMQAAKNTTLAKATNSSFLPPSLDALTTLARMDPQVIQSGIDEGVIFPNMTLADTKKFVLDQTAQEASKTEKAFDYSGTLRSLVRKVQAALEKVPVEQRERFVTELMGQFDAPASSIPSTIKEAA
jgi:hypothetical protein